MWIWAGHFGSAGEGEIILGPALLAITIQVILYMIHILQVF